MALPLAAYRRLIPTDPTDPFGLWRMLEPQGAAIRRAEEAGTFRVASWHEDLLGPLGHVHARSGLDAAFAEVASGRAGGLVVAEMHCLASSTADLIGLLECARRDGWRVVALDVGLDTSTPSGVSVRAALATALRVEQRRISERQLEKHEALRRAGRPRGRPAVPPEVGDRVLALRESEGMTWQAIADTLNAEQVSTVRGGSMWRPSSVRSAWVTRTRELAAQMSPSASRE